MLNCDNIFLIPHKISLETNLLHLSPYKENSAKFRYKSMTTHTLCNYTINNLLAYMGLT